MIMMIIRSTMGSTPDNVRRLNAEFFVPLKKFE